MAETDKRRDYRISMSAPVRYRVAKKVDDKFKLTPFYKGLGVDFCGSGAAFKVGKAIPAGYMMYLEIFFPFTKHPISVVAEVVRQKQDTLKGHKVYLCMVRYLIISPETQDKMVGYFISHNAKKV